MSDDAEPVLSVVVPTYERRDRLERVLRSLSEQVIDEPFEVIVVSDGSTDGTDEFLRGPDVPLPVVALTQSNQGPAAARNAGVERAHGELVVFVDDDVVAEPDLLSAHLRAHRELGPKVVVIGPMLDPDDHEMSPWIAWEQRMLAKQYDAMERGVYDATMRQFYTGNASLRREHILAVGGFDTALRRAEDVELAFRLDDHGLVFHFEPEAIGRHYAERPYESWRRTAYDYGRNDIVFARDHGREWIWEFIPDSFGRQHRAIRGLVRMTVASERARRVATRVLERIVSWGPVARRTRLVGYALSGVYAIEFHCGAAEELGSPAAFVALVRDGTPPDTH